jgi:CheY-like chemotaxis protein
MEAIGQLSGGIAHDFNNLLMIVLGNLETAQRNARESSPNLQRSIANAMRGAQRAAALTSRLLAFSRRQALDPKPIDLNRFLSGTVDFLQRSLGETIRIEHVGTAGLWQVELDTNQLETALVNLAINARDAMPDGGRLTIETANVWIDEDYCRSNPETTPGQYVAICVTDTGIGMNAETINRAFEPFFTTKEIGQGTGLGLSQVYGFVKQSGGHVKLYSEVNIGTTVKLYFPRDLRQQVRVAEEDLEHSWVEGEAGESILLVEDDEDVRSYLAEALRALNYRVLTAPDGKAALKAAQRDIKIDLLITDVVMPGMNGRELASAAQELRPDLPVLFISGYSRNAILSQGRVPDTLDLLQKPITQQTLSTKIRTVLDNAARQRGPLM